MPAPPLLCAALEVALNRVLRAEPAALRSCGQLAGRTLAFETRDLGWRFLVEMEKRGVRLSSDDTTDCDVTVRTSTPRLLALAARDRHGVDRPPDDVEVRGDTELLQQFMAVLGVADFDSEEALATLVGDAAAHRAAQGFRGLCGWARQGAQDMAYSGAEYLREETGDLARAADAGEWLTGVERLREGIDRLEARIRVLETWA